MASTTRNRQITHTRGWRYVASWLPLAADQPEGDDAAVASAGLIQHENDRETARNLAHPASEALRKRRRQSHERIFTTTSRDADMAGDEPAVQRERTRAGAGRQ